MGHFIFIFLGICTYFLTFSNPSLAKSHDVIGEAKKKHCLKVAQHSQRKIQKDLKKIADSKNIEKLKEIKEPYVLSPSAIYLYCMLKK